MSERVLFWSGSWRPLAALVLASAAVMGSPGPSTMSVTAVGAAFGLRRSLDFLWGLTSGTIAVLIAVATGLFALLLSVPRLAPLLLAASGAYILYLAFKIATAPPLSTADGRKRRHLPSPPDFCWLLPIPRPMSRSRPSSRARTSPSGPPAAGGPAEDGGSGLDDRGHHLAWLLAGSSFPGALTIP